MRAHARIRLVALVGLLLALLAGLAPTAPASQSPAQSYVALGDSFTAGPLIPLQIPPFGCLKSSNNYPHLAAPDLGKPVFRDPSCSGAETEDMTQPQNVSPDGPNPPQFDSLDSGTRIVTIGIGGNDIGFSEIAQNCASPTNSGTPCQDTYVVNGRDEMGARIAETAPKVAAVLRGIRSCARRADVYVVNYLPILPDQGPGCYPQIPVSDGDVPYVRSIQKRLNQMLAEQARANGATLVDAYTAGIGHDACKLPGIRWVEPVVPVNAAAPVHPNLGGMIGASELLTAALSR
jgi:lysophospholipase L1-like esterase